jgi:ATP-dependent exoDNAse (exonuclease V) beta subunit
LAILNPALYPADDAKAQSGAVVGAPKFGQESLIDRGPQGMEPAAGSVRPGEHKSRVSIHSVAWWDPNVLKLDVEENVGLRQQRILEADESGAEVARGEQAYLQWKDGRLAAITNASRPTVRVQTVTALAAGADLTEPALARIQLEKIARADAERPSGRRFGALVHAVLAAVDLDASANEIGAVAQANARLIDATPEETDAAVTTVRNVLKHPLIQRAATGQALRRETPIQHYREDGTLIEGVVDLAFQENTPDFNGWTIVDFKTDREIEKAENQYRAQVAAYVEGISVATASPARGFLLVV